MSEPICIVCGQPIEAHRIELESGIAHAVVRDAAGKLMSDCSNCANGREFLRGEISRLKIIRRSLRYTAGRLRTGGWQQRAMALYDYSDKIEAEQKRLEAIAQDYYPWTR